MSEQETKQQRIYDLLNAKTKPKFLCLPYTKYRKNFTEKEHLRKRGWGGGLNKKRKVGFLMALAVGIKKNPTTSVRKHANELKVHKKMVRTAVKQDLSTDLNPLDYAIRGVLKNKTNATSHGYIGSLKAALGRNGKRCLKNLFWRHANHFEDVLIQ